MCSVVENLVSYAYYGEIHLTWNNALWTYSFGVKLQSKTLADWSCQFITQRYVLHFSYL